MATTVQLEKLVVLAQDTLLLTFSDKLIVNDLLSDVTSYIVTDDNNEGVAVLDVLTGNSNTTESVIVVTAPAKLGILHTVEVNNNLEDSEGNTINPNFDNKQFYSRRTKMDKLMMSMPNFFSKKHRSNLRIIMQSLMREDEAIGGNRKDFLD